MSSPSIRSAAPRRNFDVLVVGAGFAGSVRAERLASGSGLRVLVIDKRPHIGGNAFDELDPAGILVHRYGPHIFHTNSDEVFAYLSRFTTWRPYEHRVLARVGGKLVPVPMNRTTLNILFGLQLDWDAQVAAFLASRAIRLEVSARISGLKASAPDSANTMFTSNNHQSWLLWPR